MWGGFFVFVVLFVWNGGRGVVGGGGGGFSVLLL